MPVLDFGEWPNPSRAVPSHRIQATMLYPNPKDNDKRQALRVMLDRKTLAAERRLVKPPAMWGSRCATDGLSPRCDSLSVAIVKYILQRCRAEAKAEAHFFQMAQNCLTKGMLAGEVLLIAMQMQALGQTRSVHTACRLLEAAANQRPTVTAGVLSVPNLTTGFSEIALRSQQTLHEKAWLRYKAVAHLWAAYNLMRNLLLQPGANGFGVVSRSPYADPDALLTLLALAERYRIWGQAFKPHAQRGKPLLDPQTTWSVPAHGILPNLAGPIVPPLPTHLEAILQGYETPSRRPCKAEHS